MAIARRAGDLPAVIAAFAAGELSEDQTRAICERAPAHIDATISDLARQLTVTQLRRLLSQYPPVAVGDGGDGDEKAAPAEAHQVTYGADRDGRWRLRATLPPDEGAVVEQALDAARDRLFHGDDDLREGTPPTEVTAADALLHIAAAYLATPGADPGSDPDRFKAIIHVEAGNDGPQAGWHLGGALPAWVRRYLTCDVAVQVAVDDHGRPVGLSSTQRTAPRWLRRLVEHRDGGCRVPGCGVRKHLHIHHVVHAEDDGPTATANLVALCRWHHRLHHRGELTIVGDADEPDGLTIVAADGRSLTATPRPRPPDPDTARPAAAPYQHPPGERLDYWWIDLPDPPPPEQHALN